MVKREVSSGRVFPMVGARLRSEGFSPVTSPPTTTGVTEEVTTRGL